MQLCTQNIVCLMISVMIGVWVNLGILESPLLIVIYFFSFEYLVTFGLEITLLFYESSIVTEFGNAMAMLLKTKVL